jgi:hypothetical protein
VQAVNRCRRQINRSHRSIATFPIHLFDRSIIIHCVLAATTDIEITFERRKKGDRENPYCSNVNFSLEKRNERLKCFSCVHLYMVRHHHKYKIKSSNNFSKRLAIELKTTKGRSAIITHAPQSCVTSSAPCQYEQNRLAVSAETEQENACCRGCSPPKLIRLFCTIKRKPPYLMRRLDVEFDCLFLFFSFFFFFFFFVSSLSLLVLHLIP